MVPLERWGTVSYLHSIATTTLYCTISEIRQDTGRKMQFFSFPLAFDIPVRGGGGFLSEYCHNVWYRKTRMVWLPEGEKVEDMISYFDTITSCDGQMDGQTDTLQRHSSYYA